MTPFPRAVVFDMDDVLCEYRFDVRLRELARMCGCAPEAVDEAIWRSGFDEDGDRGKYDARGYLAEFNRRLGSQLTAAQWLAARASAIHPDWAVLDMARAVARRRPVALLTNNGPLFKQGMASVFPELLDIFGSRAHCAYEFGGAKPEPEVFRGLARGLGLACPDLLFIDDTLEYIEGARTAGVVGHHYTGAAALAAEFGRLELL